MPKLRRSRISSAKNVKLGKKYDTIEILASGIRCWVCVGNEGDKNNLCNDPFDAKKFNDEQKKSQFIDCDKACGKIVEKKDCMYFDQFLRHKLNQSNRTLFIEFHNENSQEKYIARMRKCIVQQGGM